MGVCVSKQIKIDTSLTPHSEMHSKMKEHFRFLSMKIEGTPRLSLPQSTIYQRRHLSVGSINLNRSHSEEQLQQ